MKITQQEIEQQRTDFRNEVQNWTNWMMNENNRRFNEWQGNPLTRFPDLLSMDNCPYLAHPQGKNEETT